MTISVAELIANSLASNGASSIYCLPGVQNDDFFDALHGVKDRLPIVHSRHEQGAAYMAVGAAQATGRSQVFCVVPGPGFLNTTAALATATATNARVLAIVGEIPSIAIGKEFGLLHELSDQFGILERLTKFSGSISDGASAYESLSSVFSALELGTPSPVGLSVPTDVWRLPVPDNLHEARSPDKTRPNICGNALDKAVDLLCRARRPLIVVGGGAQSASEEVREFARIVQAPATAFRNGHGVVSFADPLFVPLPAAHELWRSTDLVIGLGTRLRTQQMQWGIDSELSMIHIDIDKGAIGRISRPEVGIRADLADALPSLSAAVEGKCPDRSDWLTTACETRSAVEARIEEKLAPQLAFLRAIRSELPPDGILVDEVTQMGYVAKFAYPCFQPRTYLTAGYQGNLGSGFPMALGAAHARRDVPVVSISGDGGFMYAIGELATAVRHDIPLKAIVFSDGAFGNVRRIQQEQYGGRLMGVDLSNPDFAAVGRSFGVAAARVDTPEGLRTTLRRAMSTDGPFLIEVPVGEFASPWEFILMPRVRGDLPIGNDSDKLY